MANFYSKKHQGLSLIEVLIAVLVLSIGLLGLAALHGFSLQSNQGAYYRTQATNLAYEVADFVRSDRGFSRKNGNVRHLDAVWRPRAAALLPGGDIQVNTLNTGTQQLVLTVSWQESRTADASDDGESVTITTRF